MNSEEDLGALFFSRIRARMLKQNKNWLAICCGETGSGKSYSAMAMAQAICPRGITIRRNVVFTPTQFMKRIANPEGLQAGDIIIFDEAGVGMSAREWYSVQNKLMGSVLQTFRHLNVGVIFTTPNLSFMDVQGRKLLHNYFETMFIDYGEEHAYLKVFDVQHNSFLDKTYYKHPKFKDEHGRVRKVRLLGIPKVSEQLAKEYEEVKSKYTQELNQKALDELTGNTGKTPQRIPKEQDDEIVKKLMADNKDYVRELNGRKFLEHGKIMSNFDISHHRATRIKRRVEEQLGLDK